MDNFDIDERYCEKVELIPGSGRHRGRLSVVLVHNDDPHPYLARVGWVVGDGVEFDPLFIRRIRFGPRVLNMIAEAVEAYVEGGVDRG